MTASEEANQWTGVDFRDRDLRGQDFSSQDLRNADFTGADLRGCNFWDSDLSGADFRSVKIGVDPEQMFALLMVGCTSALGYFFLVGAFIAFVEVLKFLEGGSHNPNATGTDLPNLGGCDHPDNKTNKPNIWVILKRSSVTSCFLVGIPFGLATIVMIGLQLLGYVNQDSTFEANVITVGALSTTIFCGYLALHRACETLTTNFSTANLSNTRFDRTSFKKAKSVGVEVDRINWQD